jgi:nitroreductase
MTKNNGERNMYAEHDLGLATENLLLQATELALAVHPMSGFDKEMFRRDFDIPEDFKIMTIIALGYPGDYDHASEEIKMKDSRERKRNNFEIISFFNGFNSH